MVYDLASRPQNTSQIDLCSTVPPLNSVPFFEKTQYIKKGQNSNFGTFEIASLPNVPGHYLRKYCK